MSNPELVLGLSWPGPGGGGAAHDGVAVLAAPGDAGGGVAAGPAHQRHVLALLHHHVLAGLQVVDVGRHVHVEAAVLLLHALRVDLAHVAAAVSLHHGAQVQLPHLRRDT